MNFKEILELIDKVADCGVASVEVEQAGTRVRIEGKAVPAQVMHVMSEGASAEMSQAMSGQSASAPVLSAPAAAAAAQRAEEEAEAGLHIVTSPIVGTFYRAPNPEAEPFVAVGDRVSKGQVLCIVEAMKLMNEIESDIDGVITRIYPQNGQPVEYGEKLYAVRV